MNNKCTNTRIYTFIIASRIVTNIIANLKKPNGIAKHLFKKYNNKSHRTKKIISITQESTSKRILT